MVNVNNLIEKIRLQPKIRHEKTILKKQDLTKEWFSCLRDEICRDFLLLEEEFLKKNKFKSFLKLHNSKFVKRKWKRKGGGGGTMSIMRGVLFEKVGVNISTVFGEFSKEFRSQIPGAEKSGKFWASGISIVAHMNNPKIPAAHMNTRFLVTGEGENKKFWFGGGCDLTPMLEDNEAKNTFHDGLKEMCNKHDDKYYKRFKSWCDDYFFLPHRNESRGVGGIFFDYLNNSNWEKDFLFVQDVGIAFNKIFKKIIKERMNLKYTKKDKSMQLEKRGRYVEFNLLYDRGTKFGLQTGGNVDGILMSLPPLAKWK